MLVKIVDRVAVSCNFCNVGELNSSGMGLVYPYKQLYEIRTNSMAGGMLAYVCPECAKALKSFIEDNKIA